MRTRYYVVLMNSKTQSYIAGEIKIYGVIAGLDDVNFVKEFMLTKFNEMDNKENWFVLQWQKFEEE